MLATTLLVCALLSAPAAATSAEHQTVAGIASFFCKQPRSYQQVSELLRQLDRTSPVVTVKSIGQSHQGRNIWLATATDPKSPSAQKIRLFIIARQHGTEASGTTATLALLQYLARPQSSASTELLRYFELNMVPIANPDGCVAGRRTNAQGVDLNRDWNQFTQPETQAIGSAISSTRPHAVMDLHELPAISSRRSYQQNFIETVGDHDSLPHLLCANNAAASGNICYWLKQHNYPLNVYYDQPGDSLSLCHRYW